MKKMIAVLLLMPLLSFAVDDSEPMEDPEFQARYETLVRELRCLVCQNQPIADSNAPLAKDLRRQVREMLLSGSSDSEIYSFMTDRYGDFVLYRPPFVQRTWLLWLAPGISCCSAVPSWRVRFGKERRCPSMMTTKTRV